ncbi:type II toxin-antitoxin system VapC family toxin [Myxosarcina sp. GI1]|uniref:type II toxin-antitoxin system VapC family toxin n=1 Tax=Myxosarcina sp. GI1 TaxID=1541065 RepID=UPI00056B355D|nr:type II toxin-antitoxin system VapC family toxin [Myxosarcina sp. GI1]
MGQLAIPSDSKVYVDTAVLIYTLEENTDYFSLLQPLWTKFQAQEIDLISSDLILMEVLVLPLRSNNQSLVSDYEQLLLNSAMQLVPISQSILRQAANLRANTNLKTPDAIHAASAISVNCDLFITNDLGFRNLSNLSAVILSEVLAS